MESLKKQHRLSSKAKLRFSIPVPHPETTRKLITRLDQYEYIWCKRAIQWSQQGNTQAYFNLVSRIGNGLVWYLFIFTIPVTFGSAGFFVSMLMAATGAMNALGYRVIKHHIGRERPYVTFAGLYCGTPPLDRYSFPSGHTLHATTFTIIACFFFPIMTWILLPLALSIALSRVVLGLHYPSDVAMATILGIISAMLAIMVSTQFTL